MIGRWFGGIFRGMVTWHFTKRIGLQSGICLCTQKWASGIHQRIIISGTLKKQKQFSLIFVQLQGHTGSWFYGVTFCYNFSGCPQNVWNIKIQKFRLISQKSEKISQKFLIFQLISQTIFIHFCAIAIAKSHWKLILVWLSCQIFKFDWAHTKTERLLRNFKFFS